MRTAIPLLLVLGCSSPASSPRAPGPVHYDLDARQWEARPLLVFGPGRDDPRWGEQTASIDGAAAGLAERDMDDVRIAGSSGVANGTPMLDADVAGLRRRFAVEADDFAVVLVGKDGGEKLRATQPIALAEVFATIDAMPMRRREMDR